MQTGFRIVPGVHDVLSASIAQTAGFDTVFLSGAALHAAALGTRDIGLLWLPELVDVASRISDRVSCTMIVDADTGFGGVPVVGRAVKALERSGAKVIQIEDQLMIKPKDQPLSRPITTAIEMIDRIHAAVDARRSESTLISARTDALAFHGLGEAIDRAGRYAEAGADLLFVQGLDLADEAVVVSQALAEQRPLLIHLPDDSAKPGFDADTLGKLGFVYGLRPHTMIRSAAQAMNEALRALGGSSSVDELDFFLISSH